MSVGQRNFLVDLQRPKTSAEGATTDGLGGIDLSDDANWLTIGCEWVMVHPQTGREFYHARQHDANLTHVIEMDWNPVTRTIDPTWRLKEHNGTRVINVLSAHNDQERNRSIMVSGQEAV